MIALVDYDDVRLGRRGPRYRRRFGIAVPMRRIADAMKNSGGRLGRFVGAFGTGGAASGGGSS